MSAPATVLFISFHPEVHLGGQRNLLRLIARLDRGRFTPVVVVGQDASLAAALRSLGVQVHVTYLRSFYHRSLRYWIRSAATSWMLRRVIRRCAARLVYVDAGEHVPPAWLAMRGSGARLVWHVQTSMPLELDRFSWRLADHMVFCSEAAQQRFAEHPLQPDRARLIPNAVDIDRFSPGEEPQLRRHSGDRVVTLYLGELVQHKGIADLLEAFALVVEQDPGHQLWIAGTGTAEMQHQLRRQAHQLGLDDDNMVRWLGFRDDTPQLLRAADIFAIPSHTEGMSLSLLEAMAAGCAVVGTDILANRSLVTPDTGVAVPVRTPAAMARGILSLGRDPELRRRLGQAARARVVAENSHARYVESFCELFSQLLAD